MQTKVKRSWPRDERFFSISSSIAIWHGMHCMKKISVLIYNTIPKIDSTCYIDDLSVIIGDVVLADNVSVWPFAVIRGDVNSIKISRNSNVQDHCMLHVSHKNDSKPDGSPLVIGEDVTIGHHVTLHGCRIGNRVWSASTALYWMTL